MKTTTQTERTPRKHSQPRVKRTGQFSYEGNWDRLCRCGRTLGVHDAVAPHPFGDYALDPREELPDCEGFKPAKTAKK